MNVRVEEVTLSDIGLSLVVIDHEYHDNLKTLRRLRSQKRDLEERIDSIEKRNADLTKYVSFSLKRGAEFLNAYDKPRCVQTYGNFRFGDASTDSRNSF